MKAGATEKQAELISSRIISRISDKPTIPSSQLSSMVARSLGQVDPAAAGKYSAYRNQKLRGSPSPAAKGAAFTKRGQGAFGVVKPLTKQVTPPQKIEHVMAATKPATAQTTTPGSLTPSQQKPAVIRLGESTLTAPLRKEIELMRLQSASRSQTISTSEVGKLMPTQPRLVGVFLDKEPMLSAIAYNAQHLPSTGLEVSPEIEVYVSPTATSSPILAVIAEITKQVWVHSDGSPVYNQVSKSGIVTYKYYYFSPDGTLPEEQTSQEVMTDGYCYALFQLFGLGVFEFTVTWPGDEEIPPLTSNIVRITVRLSHE